MPYRSVSCCVPAKHNLRPPPSAWKKHRAGWRSPCARLLNALFASAEIGDQNVNGTPVSLPSFPVMRLEPGGSPREQNRCHNAHTPTFEQNSPTKNMPPTAAECPPERPSRFLLLQIEPTEPLSPPDTLSSIPPGTQTRLGRPPAEVVVWTEKYAVTSRGYVAPSKIRAFHYPVLRRCAVRSTRAIREGCFGRDCKRLLEKHDPWSECHRS